MHTYGIVQKDGTVKKLSKAEFDKYMTEHTVRQEDILNFENASGKFTNLTKDVEVAVYQLTEDEVKEFLGYTTMHKDHDGKVVCNMTAKDAENLADITMTYVDCDHFLWSREWEEKNPGKEKAYMYADAIKENIFANVDAMDFLFLFLAIFIFNGEVTEEKRIKISDRF